MICRSKDGDWTDLDLMRFAARMIRLDAEQRLLRFSN